MVGTAAAIGLVLFFVCAAYTHVWVGDYSRTFFLGSCFFLPLAVATLVLGIVVSWSALFASESRAASRPIWERL